MNIEKVKNKEWVRAELPVLKNYFGPVLGEYVNQVRDQVLQNYYIKTSNKTRMLSSSTVYEYIITHNTVKADVEEFHVIYISSRNTVIESMKLTTGTIAQCNPFNREILKNAILLGARSIIVWHNHPSGNNSPSSADIAMTSRLKDACKVMEVDLLDHLIVTPETYYSFKDEGVL